MSSARFTVVTFLVLNVVAFAMQFAIDFSSENIAAACIVFASSIFILLYINWTDAIQTHPLSTFSIFGFCVTTQLGALLAQSITWTSLTGSLRQPIDTFAILAFFQAIAIIAHVIYRYLPRRERSAQQSIIHDGLNRLAVYATPNAGTLWIMGLVGLLAFLIGAGGQGIASKLLQGLTFLAWSPFLIPMYVMQIGDGYCKVKNNYFFLVVYSSVIALLGVAANARGLMLSGFMTIALFALLIAMRSSKEVSFLQVTKIFVFGLVLAALSIPVSDLTTAMVIARKVRGNASAVKMVEETIHYLQQPHLLKKQRESDQATSNLLSYDEAYFSSPLMARLVETKFHDNALYFASRLSPKEEEKMLDITGNFFWATLPDPILEALQIDVEKENLRFSMGDYITHLSVGTPLGGFKTGSAFAQGFAIAGALFPILYFLACPILFFAIDLLAYRTSAGQVFVSTLGMLGIWRMFQYGISAESLHHIFMGVVRGVPQNIILFLLVFYFSRIAANALGSLTRGHKSTPAAA